jgi:hypothetical protein
MKTIIQIRQLVEHISIDPNNKENEMLISLVRDNMLPLFSFNIDVSSSESAKRTFEKISENVQKKWLC